MGEGSRSSRNCWFWTAGGDGGGPSGTRLPRRLGCLEILPDWVLGSGEVDALRFPLFFFGGIVARSLLVWGCVVEYLRSHESCT